MSEPTSPIDRASVAATLTPEAFDKEVEFLKGGVAIGAVCLIAFVPLLLLTLTQVLTDPSDFFVGPNRLSSCAMVILTLMGVGFYARLIVGLNRTQLNPYSVYVRSEDDLKRLANNPFIQLAAMVVGVVAVTALSSGRSHGHGGSRGARGDGSGGAFGDASDSDDSYGSGDSSWGDSGSSSDSGSSGGDSSW